MKSKGKRKEINRRRELNIMKQTEKAIFLGNKMKEIENEKKYERNQNTENVVEEGISLGRFFDLTTGNKTYVNGLKLQEIKSGILLKYTCDFEMIGSMLIVDIEQETNTRLKNFDDFESKFNAMDKGTDSGDFILKGWLYNVIAPKLKKVNRSQYRKGTDLKRDIAEYTDKNCYIPRNGKCFIKSINYLTNKE